MSLKSDIPVFVTVKETRSLGSTVALIVHAFTSGNRHRYHVLRIHRDTGTIQCVGREVDLKLAREIAERHYQLDGEPVQ